MIPRHELEFARKALAGPWSREVGPGVMSWRLWVRWGGRSYLGHRTYPTRLTFRGGVK